MNPLVSVIVPVYNVEKFLPACIESLMAQSYKNLEIILVDDGTPDSSGRICDEYALRDDRIRVIHKKNGGVATARNTGMANMKGRYFSFVDGDDYVHENFIEEMYNLMVEHNAAIGMCGYVFKWTDGRELKTRNTEYPDSQVFTDTGCDAAYKMLHTEIYNPSSCTKLFDREKISFTFPEYAIGEDMLASISYLQAADKVVMTNKRLYYYIQNDDSVMHSVNPDKIYSIVTSGDQMLSLIPEDNKKLQEAASYYIIEKNLAVLKKLYGIDNQKDKIKHIGENIRKHRLSALKNKRTKKLTKLLCLISYFGIGTLCRIRSFIS